MSSNNKITKKSLLAPVQVNSRNVQLISITKTNDRKTELIRKVGRPRLNLSPEEKAERDRISLKKRQAAYYQRNKERKKRYAKDRYYSIKNG